MPRKNRQENAGDSADNAKTTRRRLLASGATVWTTVSLAGCSYITDPGAPDQDESDTGDQDGTDTGGNTTTDGTGENATVTNETTTTNDTDGGDDCANSREFPAGREVGLNVGVYNSKTGEYLGGDAIDQVTVEFPNADFDPLELSWSGPHEQYIPDGWGGKIQTDPDMEPGTYQYEIHIEGADVFDGKETIADRFSIR
ncbi:hypothetical protein [Halobacteriaceae bacterium SHR40]|uniref:hypothetical protein n=1 Tax=Halovenus amylolytica TaxID=2500550 RepID=UPI000FE3F2A4